MAHRAIELIIDQREGRNAHVVDAINETLRVLESAGEITNWEWKNHDLGRDSMERKARGIE